MLTYAWISSHLVLILLLFLRKSSVLIYFLSFSLLLYIYLYKRPSYDLVWYLEYMKNPWEMEIGFRTITSLLRDVFQNPKISLAIWQLSIFLALFATAYKLAGDRRNAVVIAVLSAASLFFFLTSQNALRQGVAASLTILGYVHYAISGKRSFLLCVSMLSLSVHKAVILFLVSLLIFNSFYLARISSRRMFCIGIVSGIFIYFIAQIHLGAHSVYLADIDWGAERTPSILKYFALLLVFLVSTSLVESGQINDRLSFLLQVRIFFFGLITPLAITSELFARVAYFYYCIDAIFCIGAFLMAPAMRQKMGGLLPILFSSYAPNVLNILKFM